MKTVAPVCEEVVVPLVRSRAADYLELTKPRISVLVLFTVAAGGFLAAGSNLDVVALLHAILGTALVASGASALNQWLERRRDALMRRTENRPLPSGRVQPVEALIFGMVLGVAGVAYLAVSLRQPWAALLAAGTFFSYVFVYTPLKPRTTLNTLIGAIPGAMPPLIGWVALQGSVSWEALTLVLILFLWQLPHFLAIAWIYRHDYSQGGYRMLAVIDSNGKSTATRMIIYCVALTATSLVPAYFGMAGRVYLCAAPLLGLGFLICAIAFGRKRCVTRARRVLQASLVYLPVLLALLMWDRL
jgi:protoheme IX farnesyltransferase